MRVVLRKDTTVVVEGRPALAIAAGSILDIPWPKHPEFKIYFKGDRLYVVRRRRSLTEEGVDGGA